MLIRIPKTAFAFAKSRNSGRVTNLPKFLLAGFLRMLLFPKGLTIWAEKISCSELNESVKTAEENNIKLAFFREVIEREVYALRFESRSMLVQMKTLQFLAGFQG